MENVQQLYDQAFQYWEAEDREKARETVQKALELAPDDINVNALAMHIYHNNDENFIKHAEFIIDRDIHYKDTLDKHDAPHDYMNFLQLIYHIRLGDAERAQKGDPMYAETKIDPVEFAERAYRYTRKILENGYGTEYLEYYLKFMEKTERYDEIIELAQFIVNNKSAEEIGLPGLAFSEIPDTDEDGVYHHHIMDAFFYTGRNKEALEWCNKYIEVFPDDWTIYFSKGEVCCRLNQPEETARLWITGVKKAGFKDWFDDIDSLCDMVADKACNEKRMLQQRILAIKDTISEERKALFEKINLDAFKSIGDSDEKLIAESYVEGMLKVKLPPVKKEDYFFYGRLWLPKTQGPHPYLPPDPHIVDGEISETKNSASAVIPKIPVLKPNTIERYGVDLTEQVRSKRYPPVIGRDREIDALIRILIRMEKNNPVLLGDAGVGKTAIILGLAQRINAENVPVYLRGKRIIELSMSALVGGTMWRGDFETRITDIIKELRENQNIILFVDELHTIMGAGAANRGDLDVANIAKPALAKGEIRLVGATTNHEYSLYIEKDQAMARRFTPVRVAEMDRNATLQVLRHRVDFWREHHKVNVPEKTLLYAIDLSEYHIRHRRFPDKVIDLLDESCAYISTRHKIHDGQFLSLSTDHVNHIFREWTGTASDVPEEIKHNKTTSDNKESEQITSSLQKHLVAQTKVINQLTALTLQVRHSVKDPVLPFVLLFYGQPGSGKTTAAEALSQTLWPNEQDRVMVLNMAEYSDPFSYHRLIGGPPGYAGYDEEGILAARIKRKPFSIVVLKNIREAHPQIINFFSSLFRTGMFSDKRGQDILAGDILFIIHFDVKASTGTLGFISVNIPETIDDNQALDMLKKLGLPIAFSKINFQVSQFHSLTKADMKEVLNIHIQKLKNIYIQKGITLAFTDKIQKQLIDTFYEMPGEKRNMEMLIDQYIVPKLRDKMLKSKSETIKRITIDI